MPTKDFKIVFMGTPEFAVGSLSELIRAGFNVVAVVTAPDKPAGRGQKIQESDVKIFARNYNILVLQPDKLKDPAFIDQLKSFNADLNVVVAFRMLPEIIWAMPRLGTINLHGSLLPHYRGAAPINWAVINGENETGVTTFFIEKEIDTGKIIYNDKITIEPNDNAGIVHDRLMIAGAKLLVKTVTDIESGQYPQVSQNSLLKPGESIKFAPKIFKEDCRINWNQPSQTIHNFIRGLSPYPTAWTFLTNCVSGEKLSLKIFEADFEIVAHNHLVKNIQTDYKSTLKIATSDGFIYIKQLQLEGKKKLHIEEFLRGFKITEYTLD